VVLWHGDGAGDPWGTTLDPALARIPVEEVTDALDSLLSCHAEWGPEGSAQA
jgi:hypothetical protein